jgi:hypothetical protein
MARMPAEEHDNPPDLPWTAVAVPADHGVAPHGR